MIDIPILKKVLYTIPVLLICLFFSHVFANCLLIFLVSFFFLAIYYLFIYIIGRPVLKV